ncbi:MAG: GC-type dockerin domain-anchored protein [Phycisphaerales bacterium]
MAALTVGLCTSLAAGQARFEAGYQFDDEPEVVRVESTPFETRASKPFGLQRATLLFPFTRFIDRGIVGASLGVGRDLGGGPETRTRAWAEVTFSDVVFESSGSEPIEVGVTILYGVGTVQVCCLDTIAGAVWIEEQQFELNGDVRTGTFRATITDSGDFEFEEGGDIQGVPPDRIVELAGFRVPVNTPVTLRMRVARSTEVPATTERWSAGFLLSRAQDFAFDADVFDVPDGVTVQSAQIGIRDNQRVRCLTDLDRDGELTLFDFLAFQNLFSEGDSTVDLDGDRELTLFDFLAFQNAFDAGC